MIWTPPPYKRTALECQIQVDNNGCNVKMPVSGQFAVILKAKMVMMMIADLLSRRCK